MAYRSHYHDGNSFSNSGQDSGRGNLGSSSLGCKFLAFGAGALSVAVILEQAQR